MSSPIYVHSDGRAMLRRKLKGTSQRELRDLGLLVEDQDAAGHNHRRCGGHEITGRHRIRGWDLIGYLCALRRRTA